MEAIDFEKDQFKDIYKYNYDYAYPGNIYNNPGYGEHRKDSEGKGRTSVSE